MVLRLIRDLPGDRALLPPSLSRNVSRENLAPASGRQDHTTSPSASVPLVSRRHRVHRIPPHVRDDRDTPLLSRRDGAEEYTISIFGKRNICACRTDNPNQIESAHEIHFLRAREFHRFTAFLDGTPPKNGTDLSVVRRTRRSPFHSIRFCCLPPIIPTWIQARPRRGTATLVSFPVATSSCVD